MKFSISPAREVLINFAIARIARSPQARSGVLAFLACREPPGSGPGASSWHAVLRAASVAASGGQTVRSIVFDPSRRNRWSCAITIRNDGWDMRTHRKQQRKVQREHTAARERGDFDIAGVIAGEACALIHNIPQADEIVNRITEEAERLPPTRLGGVG
jgi:hypothetical protein